MTKNEPNNPTPLSKASSLAKGLPSRVDRRRGAQIISDLYFPISHRTLEVWPVTWRHVNGRATCDTHELLAVAKGKLEAAPAIAGGKKRSCRGILISDQTQ
jgi:hypothetical protein